MGTIELRNKIIALLDTDNISYLKDIFEFAKNRKNNESSFDKLPNVVQELLNKSIEQADNGDVISHNYLMNEVSEKYKFKK